MVGAIAAHGFYNLTPKSLQETCKGVMKSQIQSGYIDVNLGSMAGNH